MQLRLLGVLHRLIVDIDVILRRRLAMNAVATLTTLLLASTLLSAASQNVESGSPVKPWKTPRCPNGARYWLSCHECACPAGEVDCMRGPWPPCQRPYDKCPPVGQDWQLKGGCGEVCTCDPSTLITSCEARCPQTLIENFYPWE